MEGAQGEKSLISRARGKLNQQNIAPRERGAKNKKQYGGGAERKYANERPR
jgi:hypothetical protein